MQRFVGNQTHSDYFKLLEKDGDHLLVAARNIVYNISLDTMQERKRLEWYSSDDDINMCKMKGKSEECQNYIRVLTRKSEDTLLVCGTNAFKPICRHYLQDADYTIVKELSGEGLCPYDPTHNSTAVFADGDLYVATVAQFTGADPLIYRDPLRTEQFNWKHLNAPNFVSSVHHGEFVYFFFRETAVEYINCGKAVYQELPEFVLMIKNLQTFVVTGKYGAKDAQLIYAVFTTPQAQKCQNQRPDSVSMILGHFQK
ncbi:hypothetical protein CEXT_441672 [Caerostris extrusa]|uniref:Sema domain-containing protein n=1 Tax=Caerostris extrusa TaxID=172846 RepID=A0AAV4X8C7_CAEEX|nr:hypothetical protein CEXT_441672 [Caerostris extrusa]